MEEQEIIEKMGPDFGPIFINLFQETAWLTQKWEVYRELFGAQESRIDLMNKTAPAFFYIVEDTLWKDLLLGVCRVTDPPETGGGSNICKICSQEIGKKIKKKNITFRAVPQFITEPKLQEKIEKEIQELIDLSKFCRDWRNKYIAHNDYKVNVYNAVNQLKPATRKQLQEVIEQIQLLTNKIEHYCYKEKEEEPMSYFKDMPNCFSVQGYGGADALIHCLEDGLRFNDWQYEKILHVRKQLKENPWKSLFKWLGKPFIL